MRTRLCMLASAAALAFAPLAARAQAAGAAHAFVATKPMHIVAPSSPGGILDQTSRGRGCVGGMRGATGQRQRQAQGPHAVGHCRQFHGVLPRKCDD